MGFLRRLTRTTPSAPEAIEVGWATELGQRHENQDRCIATSRWCVLSDGVGGQAGGATAATLTVEAVAKVLEHRSAIDEAVVHDAVGAANAAVVAGRRRDSSRSRMAATLTLAALCSATQESSTWCVATVGDSPAFVIGSGATRIGTPHTLVRELVAGGVIDPSQAGSHPGRNVLVRSIGAHPDVEADLSWVVLRPGNALVLASDGIDVLSPATIEGIVGAGSHSRDIARQLVQLALAAGATDNVTVTVVRHLPSSMDEPAAA